jgi:hypothetical protein
MREFLEVWGIALGQIHCTQDVMYTSLLALLELLEVATCANADLEDGRVKA